MERKAASGIMLLFIGMLTLAFNIQTVKAEPRTIIVPDEFSSVQEAINNANDGDTIYVRAGTYYENVVVNKTVSLVGENRNNTVIDGSYGIVTGSSLIGVSVNNVTITGFTVQNAKRGIIIRSSNNVIIGNIVKNIELSLEGVIDVEGQSNILRYNTISNCSGWAIETAGDNTIVSNNIINNTRHIWVSGSNNVISNNVINNALSFTLARSNNSVISNNIVTGTGINLMNSYNTTIANNIIEKRLGWGIVLGAFSKYNVIRGNTVINSSKGIALAPYQFVGYPAIYPWPPPGWIPEPTYNNVTENIIINNEIGLYIENSYKNIIYHNNFVNNTRQVSTEVWNYWPPDYWPPWEYVWDNGYPSGGNYWSDYKGVDLYSGSNQDQNGSDGIGDVSHFVGKVPEDTAWLYEHIDYYPLIEPWSTSTMIKTLIRTVKFWNVHKGTENSLKVKLKVAIHMLDMGKEDGAIRKLNAFINRVEMLREKTLTTWQADFLISEAQRIIDLIEE